MWRNIPYIYFLKRKCFSVFASWYWLTKDFTLSIRNSYFIYSFLFLADIAFLAPTVVKIWTLPFPPLPHCVRYSSCFFSLNKLVSFSQLSSSFSISSSLTVSVYPTAQFQSINTSRSLFSPSARHPWSSNDPTCTTKSLTIFLSFLLSSSHLQSISGSVSQEIHY